MLPTLWVLSGWCRGGFGVVSVLRARRLLMLSPASTPSPSAQGCHQGSLRPLTFRGSHGSKIHQHGSYGENIFYLFVFTFWDSGINIAPLELSLRVSSGEASGLRTQGKEREINPEMYQKTLLSELPRSCCRQDCGARRPRGERRPRPRTCPGHGRALGDPGDLGDLLILLLIAFIPLILLIPIFPPPSPPAAPSLPAGSRAVTSRGGPAGHGRHFERPGPSPPLPSPPGLPRRPLGAPAPSRSRPAPPPAAPPAPPHRHRAPWQVGDEARSRPASPGAAAAAAGRAGPREPGRGRGREAALRGAGG